MGAVNGIYLPIHKHDQLMKLLRIKKIIRSHRYATKMSTYVVDWSYFLIGILLFIVIYLFL